MMKKMTFLMVFLLLMATALAQNSLVGEYSQELQGQKIPGPLGMLFGSERVNFHLQTSDGEVVVGIIIKDKVVQSIEEGELSNPSLNVYADEETILQIQKSDNPLQTLKEAMDNGKISYKAVGFFNKIKFSVLSVFSNIASLFTKDNGTKEVIHKQDVINDNPNSEANNDNAKDDNAKDDNANSEVNNDNGNEDNTIKEEGEKDSDHGNGGLTGGVTAQVKVEETKQENTEHLVKLTNDGFDPAKITIKAGDKVTWKDVRNGEFKQGMIIGVRECRDARSGLLNVGESYSYTFNDKGECVIVDGILTTKESKVVVQ